VPPDTKYNSGAKKLLAIEIFADFGVRASPGGRRIALGWVCSAFASPKQTPISCRKRKREVSILMRHGVSFYALISNVFSRLPKNNFCLSANREV
jgi:hypothetical protein